MAFRKSDLQEDDLLAIYDLLWTQLHEDREQVGTLLNEIHTLTKENPDRWAISGDTIAKLCDIKLKQTAQVIDVMKTLSKNKQKDERLSLDEINEALSGAQQDDEE